MRLAILTTGPAVANGIGGIETIIGTMYKWLLKNNKEVKVFNYCPAIPKPSKRRKEVKEIVEYEYQSFDMNMTEDIVAEMNQYDAVLFLKEAYCSGGFNSENLNVLYHNVWKKIKTKRILWQHNGLPRSLNKMPYLWGMVNEADAILFFATESRYIKEVVYALPSKLKRVHKFIVGMDFEEFDEFRHSKDFLNRENKVVYLGRPVSIKEPQRLLAMAPYLEKRGIASEMHGIDSSMAALNYVLTRPNAIDNVRKNGQKEGITNVYGPYERKDGLEILKRSLFGCSFFNYRKKDSDYYGDRMEYTMQEIIACGCIPVFDRHWAENCRTIDGRKYSEIPYFAILSDPDNLEETAEEMKKVAENPKLQEKYRETGYKILKENNDINVLMERLLKVIEETTIDVYNFDSEKDLVEYVTGNSKLAQQFENYMNEGYLMHMAPSSLLNGKVCSLPNRTNKKLIEHFSL